MLEIVLKPLRRAEVEVVRRLVKQQYVRLFKDEAREVHPRPLAAGEQVKRLLAHSLRDIQSVCHSVAVGIHVVSAEAGKVGREPVVLRKELVRLVGLHSFGKLVEACAYGVQLAVRVLQNVLGRPSVGIDGDLRYEPQALSGGYRHRALIIVYLTRQNAEQRRFAAAVMAENADALTLGNVEAEPVKYIFTQFKGLDKSVDGYICHVFSPENYLTAA